MSIPDWYTLSLLSLAAYRVFRLLSEDDILDRPRAWVLGYRGWQEGQSLPDSYRVKAAEFVSCSACLGFWCSLAFVGAWWLWPHGTTVVCVPLAVSTLVIAVASLLDSE